MIVSKLTLFQKHHQNLSKLFLSICWDCEVYCSKENQIDRRRGVKDYAHTPSVVCHQRPRFPHKNHAKDDVKNPSLPVLWAPVSRVSKTCMRGRRRRRSGFVWPGAFACLFLGFCGCFVFVLSSWIMSVFWDLMRFGSNPYTSIHQESTLPNDQRNALLFRSWLCHLVKTGPSLLHQTWSFSKDSEILPKLLGSCPGLALDSQLFLCSVGAACVTAVASPCYWDPMGSYWISLLYPTTA